MIPASEKLAGRQEAPRQPSALSLCWEGQAESCSGTGAPPAVFVSPEAPLCAPLLVELLRIQRNNFFIPKKEEYVPCFDLVL